MIRDDLFEHIYTDLCSAPVIDTHEHLLYDGDTAARRTDVLSEYTMHYISSDLVSAGLPITALGMVQDSSQSLEKRWNLVEPYWEDCRYTGYARVLDHTARIVYGIDGIRRDTILELNRRFLAQRGQAHYQRILKELCGIEVALLDVWTDDLACDTTFFRRVWQPLHFLTPDRSLARLERLFQEKYAQPLHALQDWMDAFDLQLADSVQQGMTALKISTAYHRSLHFPEVPYETARQDMETCLEEARRNPSLPPELPTSVQNFLMHHILQRANEQNLVVQVHTGLQEGNYGTLSDSQPLLLTNLLQKYADVRFDLFHIGYPFIGETCSLAKTYPNVTIDMCWSHIVAPVAARRALSEFIDAVPANKISAFGGDFLFVDGVCGHLFMARENVASVLADKVRERVFDEEQAKAMGRRLFYDNPKRIFRL